MPRFDGTGPISQGPMTGRGMGYCIVPLDDEAQFSRPYGRLSPNPRPRSRRFCRSRGRRNWSTRSYGYGRGFGPRGCGCGFGWGWRYQAQGFRPYYLPEAEAAEDKQEQK